MKVSIDQAITNVNECMSSVFTKNDVLGLLQSIEMKAQEVNTDLLTTTIQNFVGAALDRLCTDELVDVDTAEFSLYNNQVELDSVDVNMDVIKREVNNDIEQSINDFFAQ